MTQARCPICASPTPRPLLVRPGVPASLNRPAASQAEALRAGRGRFEFAFCADCDFGFNPVFDPALAVYDDQYENEQGHSPLLARHWDMVIDRAVQARGERDGVVVEVGCGQGGFLRRFAGRLPEVSFFGLDPCFRSEREAAARVRFERATLSDLAPGEMPRRASLVLSRHVLEHVPRPVEFLREWSAGGLVGPGTPILIETPSLEWILETRTFVDFFYEHCCYFGERSVRRILWKAGFETVSVERVFGGQYFLIQAQGANRGNAVPAGTPALASCVTRFAAAEADLRERWRQQLCSAAARGPLALWGAGAKGVSWVNLLDPDRRWITCLIDINPAKQGRFVPLTGHPIVSFEDALRLRVTTAIVMNPNYESEIRAVAGRRMEVIVFGGI